MFTTVQPMIYQGGSAPKSKQVSRTVKSPGRGRCESMSLSLVVSRSAVCLLILSSLLLYTLFLYFPPLLPPVLSHQHESGAPGVQSPTSCSLLCLPRLQLCHHGDWCLGVPACSWYFLSSSLCFLSLFCLSTELPSPHIHNAWYQCMLKRSCKSRKSRVEIVCLAWRTKFKRRCVK